MVGTFEEHCEQVSESILYLNREDFRKTALSYGNSGAYATFAYTKLNSGKVIIFVDEDAFTIRDPQTGEVIEDFSAIKDLVIEHELWETYLLLRNGWNLSERAKKGRDWSIAHDYALYVQFKSADEQGLLEKLMRFMQLATAISYGLVYGSLALDQAIALGGHFDAEANAELKKFDLIAAKVKGKNNEP